MAFLKYPRAQMLLWLGLTLSIGTLGGVAFRLLNLPLPWMLGPLLFTLIAALGRVPLRAPTAVQPWVIAVIGVLLGAGFTPDTFAHAQGWLISIIGLLVGVLLSACLVVPFFVRIGRMDRVTALFSAMPGGINEMVEIGRSYGGDDRQIILSHAARIVMTIAVVAVWFRLVLGVNVGSASFSHGALSLRDMALLLVCGGLGVFLGNKFRMPAPTFFGPMLLSAAVHLAGLSAGSPPTWLVIVAQIILGTNMGCRFLGVPMPVVLRAIALGFGASLIMLLVALAFAIGVSEITHQSAEQILLAYAPGGLTEMSLVALSMGGDIAFIATHHIIRIIAILAVAPVVLGYFARRILAASAAPISEAAPDKGNN